MIPDEIFSKKHLRPKIIFGVSLIVVILLLIATAILTLCLPPKVKTTSPANNTNSFGLKSSIEVTFNRPVDRKKLQEEISPNIPGQWHFGDDILGTHLYRKITFTPDGFFEPEKNYKVSLKNLSSILVSNSNDSYEFTFKTQSIPKITGTNIPDPASVSISSPIEVNLDGPNGGLENINFTFSPIVPNFQQKLSPDKKKYVLTFPTPLSQGVKFSLSASRTILAQANGENLQSPPENIWQTSFTTKQPPGIASFSPTGNLVKTDTSEISLTFLEPMDQNSVLNNISISPSLSGNWKWGNSKTIIFSATAKLTYGTAYTVTIKKGTKDLGGGYTTSDAVASFSTIGHVTVSSNSPKNGGSGTSASAVITITFNQEVDHSSAQSAFSIDPNTSGSFSWSGNTMSFKLTSGLSQNTNYSVNIASGVKSIYGLDSDKSFGFSFSTQQSSVVLNIPIDYQDKPLSCEAASLKMALNYRGAGVSEDDIMNVVGFDPTIRNGNVWGNPYIAFVGSINGREDTTGYGVYWGPIAAAAKNWRSAESFSGWTASQIAIQIANGNPVEIWGTFGSASRDDWYTPDGQYILAWKGEHARLVIGFTGSSDNPTQFTINDPIAGRITWSTSTLLSNWSAFGNSGVVIY